MVAPRRVVYTALIGQYEELLEQPAAAGSGVTFICFTDDPNLSSSTWQVRLITPAFPEDPVRSARMLKIRGHSDLAEFDENLWIDNTVFLKTDPELIFDEWLDGADIALPLHSYRETVDREFEEVLRLRLDDPARIREQHRQYVHSFPDVLESKPHWTAILARRNTEIVAATMSTWMDHVLRYSRRDQLSEGVAFSLSQGRVKSVEIDNFESALFAWPVAKGRKGLPNPIRVGKPRTAEDWKGTLNEALLQAAFAIRHREVVIEEMEAELGGLKAELTGMQASRSWRMCRPIRYIARVARSVMAKANIRL